MRFMAGSIFSSGDPAPHCLKSLTKGKTFFGGAVAARHGGMYLLVGRPGAPLLEVVDEGKNLLRRRLDDGGTLDAEIVRPRRRIGEDAGDADRDDGEHDERDLEQGFSPHAQGGTSNIGRISISRSVTPQSAWICMTRRAPAIASSCESGCRIAT